jgi:CheY-like chemotaxis protein
MSRTILIVDDSGVDRQRLESLLADAGYVTTTAVDGSQALDAARRTKPHAILMDISMPEMDGFAATRAL